MNNQELLDEIDKQLNKRELKFSTLTKAASNYGDNHRTCFESVVLNSGKDCLIVNSGPKGIISVTCNGATVVSRAKIKRSADTGGLKFDDGKARFDLIDPTALEELANVLAFGAKKYGENNWRKGISNKRICAAILRHVFAHLKGEMRAPDTGLPHIAHAMCNCMFLLGLKLCGNESK